MCGEIMPRPGKQTKFRPRRFRRTESGKERATKSQRHSFRLLLQPSVGFERRVAGRDCGDRHVASRAHFGFFRTLAVWVNLAKYSSI